MDEDDHRRAQEEMIALSLRHLQQLQDSKKFVNRMISMLYKALAVGIVLGLISLLPPQLPSFVGHIRRTVFARTWDVVNVLLVALAISYGVLGRVGRQENEAQIDGNESREEYEGRIFDYESVNRRRGLLDRNVESSENVVVESSSLYEHDYAYEYPVAVAVAAPPLRRIKSSFSYQDLRGASRAWDDSNPPRAMDDTDWVRRNRHAPEDSKGNTFGYSVPKSNGGGDSVKASNGREDSAVKSEKSSERGAILQSEDIQCPKEAEVKLQDFDFSAQVKNNVVTEEQCKHPPPAPSPPRNATPQRDSNPRPPSPLKNMNPIPFHSEKRRRKPPSPPPPPPPPPRPPPPPPPPPRSCNPPALEPHLPKQMIRPTPDSNPHHSHEKPEKPKKVEKIKSDKKFPVNPIPNPPNPPPLPAEIPNHESRRGRSKDDSKHRATEHKPSRGTIVNAFGLLPQSERRNKKNPIPTPPVPPPPPSTSHPSTLHKWFQSYNKKDSKHKSKDSEPSPRHRSDKSRRKVHSSNSPPSPPPPPPAYIYTTEPTYPKKRASEKHEKPKPPIYSTDSNYPKNVETSKKIEAPKPPVYTPDPQYQKDEGFEEVTVAKKASGRRNSSEYWKANVSGDAITRDPGYQKDEGFDEIAVSNRVSGRRNTSEYWKENVSGDAKATEKLAERKSSSIPLPPPPPPPFPLVEHHWSFYDDPKLQKKKVSSPAELAEAEPVQESEPEPEIGWGSVFRKQFSVDNADSPFCPSPSPDEVNRKADAFIARMHQQLRLQKSNSSQERLN